MSPMTPIERAREFCRLLDEVERNGSVQILNDDLMIAVNCTGYHFLVVNGAEGWRVVEED